MTRLVRLVLFMADKNQPYDNRFRVTNGQKEHTDILRESLYCSGDIPQVGDRLTEFVRVPGFEDPRCPLASTHSREGDWQVSRVEEYVPDLPMGTAYTSIVICHCQYNPCPSPLEPMEPAIVSVESFGGDQEAYQNWLDKQKEPVKA